MSRCKERYIVNLVQGVIMSQDGITSSEQRPTITLRSSDDLTFIVDNHIAKQSRFITLVIEDTGHVDVIPLSNVKGSVLSRIIDYLRYHDHHEDTRAWDKAFIDVPHSDLFDIIIAANYLDIPSILDCSCQAIANLIKGRTPEELRIIFDIKNDFSPEEEADVQRENEWAFS